MKLKLLAAVFAVLPLNAMAVNWVEISDTEEASLYLDTDSPFIDDGNVLVWTLGNLKKDLGAGAYSFRALWQIDCDRKRMRVLQMPTYEAPMGQGRPNPSSSSESTAWEYPIPGSTNASIQLLMCLWKSNQK